MSELAFGFDDVSSEPNENSESPEPVSEGPKEDYEEPLERLRKDSEKGDLLQRLRCAQDLYDVSLLIGHEMTHREILPIITNLIGDQNEVIRREIISQTVRVCSFFNQPEHRQEYYEDILYLLTLVQRYTTDTIANVRQTTMDALIEIGGFLDENDIFPRLLPIVKSLTKDKTEEEHRVEGATLLNELAPVMKESLCLSFAIPYMKELAEDPSFRVQKAVAASLGKICKVVGPTVTTNEILPIYERLSSHAIWGVRKACVSSLVELSENLPPQERENRLVPIFERLTTDSSRWVVMAANQILGRFIFTFYKETVPPSLVIHFKNIAKNKDYCKNCASNFPAVVYTLGSENWDDNLFASYKSLTEDKNVIVRLSLSSSLHEIAKILGTSLTEKYLLDPFDLFLKDMDVVKYGVVSNMSEFLKVLSHEKREKYIENLEIISRDSNWRFRKLLAKHIGSISLLFSLELFKNHIFPIYKRLKDDPISAVRKSLTKSIYLLIRASVQDPELAESLIKDLKELAKDSSYQKRQLFASICLFSYKDMDNEIFRKEFLPELLLLANDQIPNVRLIVSQVLHLLYLEDEYKEDVASSIEILKNDNDIDVAYFAKNSINLNKVKDN